MGALGIANPRAAIELPDQQHLGHAEHQPDPTVKSDELPSSEQTHDSQRDQQSGRDENEHDRLAMRLSARFVEFVARHRDSHFAETALRPCSERNLAGLAVVQLVGSFDSGKGERHVGPSGRRVVDGGAASVGVRDRRHDREPETGTGSRSVSAAEPLEG